MQEVRAATVGRNPAPASPPLAQWRLGAVALLFVLGACDEAPARIDVPEAVAPTQPLPAPARDLALPDAQAYPATVGHAVDDAIFRGLHAATTQLLADLDPSRSELKGAPAHATETDTDKPRGTILRLWFTSNVHGEREDCGCKKNPLGGLTRKSTLIQQTAEGKFTPDVQLVLDAGDLLFQGPHLARLGDDDKAAAQERALAIVESFNAMGCDGFTPGEYDTVLGIDRLLALHKASRFPWISANLRKKGTTALLFAPYLTRDIAGMKVAVVGITNNVGPEPAYYDNGGFSVGDPLQALRDQAPAIAAEKPDAIVLLSNLGIQGTTDLIKAAGDFIPVNMGLVSGSNRSTFTPVWAHGNVPVFEAGHRGKNLGRVDVHVVDKGFAFEPTSSPWTVTVRDYAGAYRSLSNARKAVWKNRDITDEKRKERIATNRDRALARLVAVEAGLPDHIERPAPTAGARSWVEPKVVPVKLAITEDKRVRKIIDAREAKAARHAAKAHPPIRNKKSVGAP